MPEGLRLALTTFTVLPLGPGRVDRATARTAMLLGPAVGALLGAAAGGVLLAAAALLPEAAGTPTAAAALAVGTLAGLTRGLHLDGLADLADGLGSARPPAAALEVMRRSDVGPFGVATLVLVLLVQVGALTALPPREAAAALVVAAATARLAVVLACTPGTPAARPDGLGALVAGTVPVAAAVAAGLVVAAAAAAVGAHDGAAGALRAVVAVAAGLGVAGLLLRRAVQRLGGVTGDVLGALLEAAATVAILVLATR